MRQILFLFLKTIKNPRNLLSVCAVTQNISIHCWGGNVYPIISMFY